MLEMFYPYEYAESVFVIDMTLVPHGFDATEKVETLFKNIHGVGLKTLLLTNNSEDRVKKFIKNIDTPYICDAEKPNPKNYLKAVEMLGIEKSAAVYVGDQIFIDIYGANKSGIASILVKYVTACEEKNIGIRRNLEKIILKFYSRSQSCKNRIGDIYLTEAL